MMAIHFFLWRVFRRDKESDQKKLLAVQYQNAVAISIDDESRPMTKKEQADLDAGGLRKRKQMLHDNIAVHLCLALGK